MQTNEQVAGEAREKLAGMIEMAVFAQRLQGDATMEITMEFGAWKEVIAALRAQPERGAEEMRERAVQVAKADRGVDDCPYSNDKPGDPTWHHTDDDVCPRCHKVGKDSGSACVGIAKHRIAAAIRALPLHPAKDEGGGHG